MERREVLKFTALAGATGVFTLAPVSFAGAEPAGAGAQDSAPAAEETRTVTGHLPTGVADFVYLPVNVPHGVREIAVSYTYDRPAVPVGTVGNACDIGIFDQHGTALGGKGFRGWSGGARTAFTISAEQATPGYLAGPVSPGTWNVVLGPYTVAPQGLDYSVTITLRYGPRGTTPAPTYPPQHAKGRGRAWYRGDCHLHTVHSDGQRTPAEVTAAARAAGLDFINTSEHNTTSAHSVYGPLAGDDLLVLTGEEITTRNGHYLAIGTDPGVWFDWRYRARDDAYARFARKIRGAGGLVVPAHPYGIFPASQWKFGYDQADAIEVWNGPWGPDDELSLNTWDNLLTASTRGDGHWIPAMGNSDAHREPQVVGLPQTVVLADGLDRAALLAGIRAGRSWLAESSDVQLAFTATGPHGEHAGIGERLVVGAEDVVTVRLEVSGVPGVPVGGGVFGAQVRLMTDEGQMFATQLAPSGAGSVEWRTTASLAAYVRAEVRHPVTDGGVSGLPGAVAALTNPMWLDVR
ncbi:CehA/McbA family metallohydrolase [Streptomyces sp. So13.3]|uniref:CehA/McbA family metallohydrolase n=1 Tax=unclassified Streptomyces TaxID=2593676 RepID=UPI0011066437|nr:MULTISPECIES: CehA/McbA family metallohydrolase [unclassified Streptomyces]MCZ4095645.1 CehA/McbA family metallohydrolase [Streptomyces sp. H39-C1]QNA73876.1 CehA/McbA family metallohydrolase [Streptomyces sp. So13.3]